MKGFKKFGFCDQGIFFLRGALFAIILSLGSASALYALSPDQAVIGPYLERMTPAQRQIFDDMTAKSGGQVPLDVLMAFKNSNGQVTPEVIDAIRKNGIDLTPEQIEILKTGKTPDKQPAVAPKDQAPKTQAEVKQPAQIEPKPADKTVETKAAPPQLRRYGVELFRSGRARIQAIEEMIGKGQIPPVAQKDAIAGFVGPIDMGTASVNASVPPSYALSPGDQVTVYYWGDMMELTSVKIQLDDKGEVTIPKAGRLVARGMSLSQFQSAVKDLLTRGFGKSVSVIATLDSLKSIQIFITGEAFRPGSYAVSSNTTLFNALLSSGGPSDAGSLRDIRLIRRDKTTSVDFYAYLMQGDSKNDFLLQPGDAIFITSAEKLVSIEGEVNRPAVYELKKGERLKDLVRMAEGIKPGGLSYKVHITSIIPNRERVVADVDMSNTAASDRELFDGDSVSVIAIVPEILNKVTLSGNVKYPGVYELRKNMRVADLFNEANQPWGEAYLERAEIIRLDKDRKTTTIIPFNLGKALQKDASENLQLAPLDRVVVYSKWDVQFYPERTVIIRGAVQNPGDYPRSDGMRISDLLVKAGGLMPNVYMARADLLRYDFAKETWQIIPVDISRVMEKDKSQDIILNDRDLLHIFAKKEAAYTYEHEVDINGAVQRPGAYKRGEGMRLQDLLFAAGGLLPGASHVITIAKAGGTGKTITIEVNFDLVNKGDPAHNVLLDDTDIVMVRVDSEYYGRPRWVTVKGEIRYPGSYPILKRDERISEIIARAGGLTNMANPKGTVYMRKIDFIPSEEQKRDIQVINKLTNSLNDLEYQRQAARNLWLMQKEGGIMTAQSPSISGPQVVSGSGTVSEAAAIAMAPSIAQASGKITSDVIGTLETGAGTTASARKLENADLAQSERIVLNLDSALKGDNKEDLQVHEGDSLIIPRKMETVSIVGAVMKPVTLNVNKKWKLKKYINRAGGFAADGDSDRVVVSRVDGTVMTADEVDYIEPGDVIYVPTRVISTEITTTADKVVSVVKFTLATVASVVVFLALLP